MLHFITGNKNKFQEFQDILWEDNIQQLDIDLPELQEIDARKIIEHKLQEALKHHPWPLLTEDTSLYMECLWRTLPWPFIKRFFQELDNQWLYALAKATGKYKARASVLIGYAKTADDIQFFEGTVEGTIVEPIHMWDFWRWPIFHPQGHDKSYGAMNQEEKNAVSMRRMALDKLKEFLEQDL